MALEHVRCLLLDECRDVCEMICHTRKQSSTLTSLQSSKSLSTTNCQITTNARVGPMSFGNYRQK
jgi:hypothetical protein